MIFRYNIRVLTVHHTHYTIKIALPGVTRANWVSVILLRILLSGQLPTENEKEVFVAFFATV